MLSLGPKSPSWRYRAGSSDFFLREPEQYQWPDPESAARIYKVKRTGVFIMNHGYILGINVAKAKLDIALRLPNGKLKSKVVPDSSESFTELSAAD